MKCNYIKIYYVNINTCMLEGGQKQGCGTKTVFDFEF